MYYTQPNRTDIFTWYIIFNLVTIMLLKCYFQHIKTARLTNLESILIKILIYNVQLSNVGNLLVACFSLV